MLFVTFDNCRLSAMVWDVSGFGLVRGDYFERNAYEFDLLPAGDR